MKAASVLIFIIWCCFPCLSQDLLPFKVQELFEGDKEGIAVDFFHGRLDGMEEIVIAMACRKKECRGVLRYIRSKEEINLKGSIRKNDITLEEYNTFGKVTGSITAKKSEKFLTGWWSSNNGNTYFDFELEKVDVVPSKPAVCGPDSWVKHFSAEDSNIKLLVQNIESRGLRGSLYTEKSAPGYQLVGTKTNAGYYELDIYEFDQVLGTLICGFSNQENQKVIFKWNNKKDQQVTFIQTENFSIGCQDYGDFVGNYSTTYPITNHIAFNNWLENESSDFIAQCKAYGKEVRKSNPRMDPEIRSTLQAVGWTEINYYNRKMISGVVHFIDNWSPENKSTAFIYDLQNDVLFDQNELLIPGKELTNLVEQEKEKLKKKYNHQKTFCTWIDKQAFDLINIQHNGISLVSSFHSVFGKEKIVIPFDTISPYLLSSEALTLLAK